MISRASTASQLSSRAGIWDDADGRCVVVSSSTSTAGDGVLVLRFRLPDTDGVVLLPGLQVVVLRVVLVVVLPMPRGPVVEISEIKFKRKHLHCLLITSGCPNTLETIFIWQFKEPSTWKKISQCQGIWMPPQYHDSHLTNAKHQLVHGSAQLKSQKTKLQHNPPLQ